MSSQPEAAALVSTQRAFVAAVLGGPAAAAPLLDQLQGPRPENLRRLAAYHRNIVGNRIAALRSTYPQVLAQLAARAGERAFDEIASRFALSHDSTCGDLNDYGEDFADCLQTTPGAAACPWLPDLARLEWDIQAAWYAADCAPFDFAALATVPAERHGELRFQLAPAWRMRVSAWPLAAIWTGSAPAAVAPEEQCVWIVRPGVLVSVVTATPGEFAFVAALAGNSPLADAIATASMTDDRFDVGHTLARAAGLGLLAGFTLSGEPS